MARKYALTLESISLQTRHIIDVLNKSSGHLLPTGSTPERQEGHKISAIFVSGGQTTNKALMQLLANVCGMPVVLPANSGGAVVLGAAILGRFAKEVSDWRASHDGTDKLSSAEQNRILWNIMVRRQRVESRFS